MRKFWLLDWNFCTQKTLFTKILDSETTIFFTIFYLLFYKTGNLLCLLVIWYRNHTVGRNPSTSSGQESRIQHGMSGYMYIFIRGLACADLCYLCFNLLACYFGSNEDLLSKFYVARIIQPTWNAFKVELVREWVAKIQPKAVWIRKVLVRGRVWPKPYFWH